MSLPRTSIEAPVVIFAMSLVAGNAGVGDDLEIAEAGAVVEFEKRERLRIPAGADPAGDVKIIGGFLAAQDVLDQGSHALG